MTSITPRGVSIISALKRVHDHYSEKMLWSNGRHTIHYVCPLLDLSKSPGEELRLSRFLSEWEQSPERRFDILLSQLLPTKLHSFHRRISKLARPLSVNHCQILARQQRLDPRQHTVAYCFDIHCIPIGVSSLCSASVPKTSAGSSFMSLHNFR